jgi:hypothetical protein
MKNSKIISLIITLGALIDTLYTVVTENQSLLLDLGITPKTTKIIMVIGLVYTAFSKSLIELPSQKRQSFADDNTDPMPNGTPKKKF